MSIQPIDPVTAVGSALRVLISFREGTRPTRGTSVQDLSNRRIRYDQTTGKLFARDPPQSELADLNYLEAIEWTSDPAPVNTGKWPDANGVLQTYILGQLQVPPSNPQTGSTTASGQTGPSISVQPGVMTSLAGLGIHLSRVNGAQRQRFLAPVPIPYYFEDTSNTDVRVNSDFGLRIYIYVNPGFPQPNILMVRGSEAARYMFEPTWRLSTLTAHGSEPGPWRYY